MLNTVKVCKDIQKKRTIGVISVINSHLDENTELYDITINDLRDIVDSPNISTFMLTILSKMIENNITPKEFITSKKYNTLILGDYMPQKMKKVIKSKFFVYLINLKNIQDIIIQSNVLLNISKQKVKTDKNQLKNFQEDYIDLVKDAGGTTISKNVMSKCWIDDNRDTLDF